MKITFTTLLPDHYVQLGVEQEASPTEIKKAFHRLARKHHPDKTKANSADDALRFRQIKNAYEVLIDNDRRLAYDASLRARAFKFDVRLHPETENAADKVQSAETFNPADTHPDNTIVNEETIQSFFRDLISDYLQINQIDEVLDMAVDPMNDSAVRWYAFDAVLNHLLQQNLINEIHCKLAENGQLFPGMRARAVRVLNGLSS